MPLTISPWGHYPAGREDDAARVLANGNVDGVLQALNDRSPPSLTPIVPIGAAAASAVAAFRAAPGAGNSSPSLRDLYVVFGGERLADESGRRAPTADLFFVDRTSGTTVNRPALSDASWPEPRKFGAAATVYKPGGFAIFEDVEQVESRKVLGKTRSVVGSGLVASGSAAGGPTVPTRKGSAGNSREASKEPEGPTVHRLSSGLDDAVAADRAFAAATTGACAVIFGGIDASGGSWTTSCS